jgi:type II secretory ATPase GspE/PulE/Tfp pilus assembly ATPase PilB-like protein
VFSGGETWHTILLDRLRQLAGLPASQGRPGGRILQRGRFAFPDPAGTDQVLFRVSVLRGVEGEEAQAKLIRREGLPRHLTDLGFTAHQCLEVRRALARPGLVWVTAPGEEGMGSTLFGLLREIPGQGRTFTLEEEVFYRSPDLLQLETLDLGPEGRSEVLRELKYLDFPRVLVDRASPSQLADLLALAVRKRWILAGGHEASLEESLTALAVRSGDVPLYGLSLVVHQRLVPLLCRSCRASSALGTAERQALQKLLPAQGTVYQEGSGCDACGGRGTRGARAFFEVLPVDAAVREDLYGAARGERRIPGLVSRARPSIASQVAEGVARGEVSLSEIWDFA